MHPTFERALEGWVQADMLVALCDWTLFSSYARTHASGEVFSALADFYLLVEQRVETSGGIAFKFMGDAALLAFPRDCADSGVATLLELQSETNRWFESRHMDNRLHVNAHVGEVTLGPMGHKRQLDLIGETVNITAGMGRRPFALSQQAFRCLTAEQRRLFRRFTPPLLYLPAAAR